MTLDPEIEAAVARLDQRIAKLQKAKESLLAAFSDSVSEQIQKPTRARPKRAKDRSASPRVGSRTRREEMVAFFRENGPARRAEIVAKTRIPVGTAAYLLNDKRMFRRLESGRWNLRRELKEEPTTS